LDGDDGWKPAHRTWYWVIFFLFSLIELQSFYVLSIVEQSWSLLSFEISLSNKLLAPGLKKKEREKKIQVYEYYKCKNVYSYKRENAADQISNIHVDAIILCHKLSVCLGTQLKPCFLKFWIFFAQFFFCFWIVLMC
jgi:hypothetical protein